MPYQCRLYEWTYLLDTFNNAIISHHISAKRGDRTTYFKCLDDLKAKIKTTKHPTILHTDQGSVYASLEFEKSHQQTNIVRSMSRAGTPTDNPIIESINGWIKEEMNIDFHYQKQDNLSAFLNTFVDYFNLKRPAYALNYKTPAQFKTEQGF